RPYRHRRNLPPVLHGLGRLPASLTILVIGDIGVILIRKETQCQRVKGVIVQRLFHPPVQDCQQVTIKCFHVVHHHVPPSPPHPNLLPPGGKEQNPSPAHGCKTARPATSPRCRACRVSFTCARGTTRSITCRSFPLLARATASSRSCWVLPTDASIC